jgi:hypothetical protein
MTKFAEATSANAGDGVVRDNSTCSEELRTYIGQVSSGKIAKYIEYCLASSFPKSGMVLQDLVNELGRRLDYEVSNGRYQGVTNAVGFDGIWQSPERHSLILEVKTTDAYRLSLDTLARYRSKLRDSGAIGESSSILIVVGRQETGELEAQIRGSRHAWDVRLISVEALLKLVSLKENSEADETGQKIRGLLTPVEYTRLDGMVDVMFTTAKDVEGVETVAVQMATTAEQQVSDSQASGSSGWQFTSPKDIQAKREEILLALAARDNVPLVRKTRALYWNAQHNVRVACSVSKRYEGKGQYAYWYAYHPKWDEFLAQGDKSYFVLGCMDKDEAFAIPRGDLLELLPYLNTTTPEGGDTYWHIHIADRKSVAEILVPKRNEPFRLEAYVIKVASSPTAADY